MVVFVLVDAAVDAPLVLTTSCSPLVVTSSLSFKASVSFFAKVISSVDAVAVVDFFLSISEPVDDSVDVVAVDFPEGAESVAFDFSDGELESFSFK